MGTTRGQVPERSDPERKIRLLEHVYARGFGVIIIYGQNRKENTKCTYPGTTDRCSLGFMTVLDFLLF